MPIFYNKTNLPKTPKMRFGNFFNGIHIDAQAVFENAVTGEYATL